MSSLGRILKCLYFSVDAAYILLVRLEKSVRLKHVINGRHEKRVVVAVGMQTRECRKESRPPFCFLVF